jgi:hypothetical protein
MLCWAAERESFFSAAQGAQLSVGGGGITRFQKKQEN